MKKLVVVALLIVTIYSCKDCRVCRYSTFKGDIVSNKFCSSIKEDRVQFEAQWDSIAKANNSIVRCTKETFK